MHSKVPLGGEDNEGGGGGDRYKYDAVIKSTVDPANEKSVLYSAVALTHSIRWNKVSRGWCARGTSSAVAACGSEYTMWKVACDSGRALGELAQCLDCCNLRFLVAVPRFKVEISGFGNTATTTELQFQCSESI